MSLIPLIEILDETVWWQWKHQINMYFSLYKLENGAAFESRMSIISGWGSDMHQR